MKNLRQVIRERVIHKYNQLNSDCTHNSSRSCVKIVLYFHCTMSTLDNLKSGMQSIFI
jgi:hypothetical protein